MFKRHLAILVALLVHLPSRALSQPMLQRSVLRDSARAEAPERTASKTFFTRRDLAYSGIALVASAAISHFDLRVARWSRRDAVQGSQARQDLVGQITQVNELPLTIAAVATYGIGRLAGSSTVADVGLHTTESLVLTIAVSELIRGPVGRVRPRASIDDQYKFEFGGGFTKFEDRSFPSLHSSAAFATASSLVSELQHRRPDVARYAAPVLYTAALLPGLSRIHLDEHWASDVVAGAFVGALLGSRVVGYAHSHDVNTIDKALLGFNVVPAGDGRVLLLLTARR